MLCCCLMVWSLYVLGEAPRCARQEAQGPVKCPWQGIPLVSSSPPTWPLADLVTGNCLTEWESAPLLLCPSARRTCLQTENYQKAHRQGEGNEVMSLGYFRTLVIGARMVKKRHAFYIIPTPKRDYFPKVERIISKFMVSWKLEKVSFVFPKTNWFVSPGPFSAAHTELRAFICSSLYSRHLDLSEV